MGRYFEKTAEKNVVIGWSHGRYLDLWSIVHLITGAVLGLVSLYFAVNMYVAFGVSIALMTIYEGVEVALKIAEDVENVLMDIVIGGAGFVLVAAIFPETTEFVHIGAILG